MKSLIVLVVVSATLVIAYLWNQANLALLYLSIIVQTVALSATFLDKSIQLRSKVLMTIIVVGLMVLSFVIIVYSRSLMVRHATVIALPAPSV